MKKATHTVYRVFICINLKFNALYGSNTKPRAQFKSPADNVKDFAHLKKLSDQKVHFDGLFAVTSQD